MDTIPSLGLVKNMSKDNESFLDPKTIMAIVLVALSWVVWDSYMKTKYPHVYEKKSQIASPTESVQKEIVQNNKVLPAQIVSEKKENSRILEKLYPYKNEFFSFVVTSKGMGLYDVVLKKYTDRKGLPMELGKGSQFTLFETNLIGRNSPLDFAVEQVDENKFVGKAFHGSTMITKELSINPKKYTVDVKVKVSKITIEFLGLTTYLSENIKPKEESSFLVPVFGGQEIFTLNSEGKDRIFVSDLEEGQSQHTYNSAYLVALGTKYFTQAILDKSNVVPNFVFFKESNSIVGRLNHSMLNRSSEFSINYMGFIGPKSISLLKSFGSDFSRLIDFGWFHWIGKKLLELMIIFYQLSNNWGVSIILMTILIRIFLLPLNIFSYRSMKKMQIIQPDIKRIRETYKDNPQQMNKEIMTLMRDSKVNPFLGCLPMLLQFPIFIALYRVLGQSIELYQAPFTLWIQDLSLKDPFYILPVLMGGSMFLQMKIQPNTMEPAQRKIMMMMPIIFSFFMLGLPSGLTLYILVSTVFGILQHFCFMRDSKETQVLQQSKEKI